MIQARRFDIGHENGILWISARSREKNDADLIRENLVARIVDHAAAVAVPVKPRNRCPRPFRGPCARWRGGKHFESAGIGIVARESIVEIAIHFDDLTTDLRRNASGANAPAVPVAAGGDDFRTLELPVFCDVVQIALLDAVYILIKHIGALSERTMSFSRPISSGPKVRGVPRRSSRPSAVFIVAGRDHMATAGQSSSNCAK